MSKRKLIAKELAEVFKIIAHPDRIRLIEELGSDEKDVNSLIAALELPGPRVSQHLALMRAHRVVEERREGRHHVYRLLQPQIAEWILEGLDFIEGKNHAVPESAIRTAKALWTQS